MKRKIEIFKRKTGFYKIGRKKYFERVNLIALLSLILLIIIGRIQKRYVFSSFTTTTLDIICISLFIFTIIVATFSIYNEIENNKKYHKSTLIASLPYLLMVLSMIIVFIISFFL